MVPVRNWGEAVLSSIAAALGLFFSAIPRILGFAAILIIGWMIASALAGVVASLLRTVRFNDLAERSGLSGFVQRMGVRTDASGVLADVVKWFVRLIVLVVAFDALGLTAVSQVLQQLVLWLPNLAVALVILVIAGLVANAVHDLVRGTTAQAGLGNPDLLASVARLAIWAFAVVVVVNQIGVAQTLVNTLFMAVVAAIALAIGLAFGLGARDTAGEIARDWYRRGRAAAPALAYAAGGVTADAPTPDGDHAVPTPLDSTRPVAMPAGPGRQGIALEASREPSGTGLTIHLPVRAERIAVEKQAVISEKVAVRSQRIEDVVRIGETVRRERVDVQTHGDIEAERSDAARPRGDGPGRSHDRTQPMHQDGDDGRSL